MGFFLKVLANMNLFLSISVITVLLLMWRMEILTPSILFLGIILFIVGLLYYVWIMIDEVRE